MQLLVTLALEELTPSSGLCIHLYPHAPVVTCRHTCGRTHAHTHTARAKSDWGRHLMSACASTMHMRMYIYALPVYGMCYTQVPWFADWKRPWRYYCIPLGALLPWRLLGQEGFWEYSRTSFMRRQGFMAIWINLFSWEMRRSHPVLSRVWLWENNIQFQVLPASSSLFPGLPQVPGGTYKCWWNIVSSFDHFQSSPSTLPILCQSSGQSWEFPGQGYITGGGRDGEESGGGRANAPAYLAGIAYDD